MDVHEYQAKELLASFGVAVPKGAVAFSRTRRSTRRPNSAARSGR